MTLTLIPRKKIMADLQHAFVRKPDTDGFHIKSLDLEGSLQVGDIFKRMKWSYIYYIFMLFFLSQMFWTCLETVMTVDTIPPPGQNYKCTRI